jgi:CO/xanthine dehydrogenase FAD-binding subunit
LVHRKLRARGSIDYPLLLTAVRVDLDESQMPTGGRVVLSAVGPHPIEVTGISDAIARRDAAGAAHLAWRQTMPLSTHIWPSTWRKKMVRVEVRRALVEAFGDQAA